LSSSPASLAVFFEDVSDVDEEAPEAILEGALASVLVGVEVRGLVGAGGEGCEGGAAFEDCVDKDDGARPDLVIPDINPILSALAVDAGLDSAGRSAGLTEDAGRGTVGRSETLRFDAGRASPGRSAALKVDAGLERAGLSAEARPVAAAD